MPLTSSDINRLQSRSGRSGIHKGYYGFRRAMGVSRQMRDIIRRLDELEAIDSELAREIEQIFSVLSDVEGGVSGIMSYFSMGVAGAIAYGVHPALGIGMMALGGIQRGLKGGKYAVDVITKGAVKYGGVPQRGGGVVFTGPGGGRAQYEKWRKEQAWRSALALFGITL